MPGLYVDDDGRLLDENGQVVEDIPPAADDGKKAGEGQDTQQGAGEGQDTLQGEGNDTLQGAGGNGDGEHGEDDLDEEGEGENLNASGEGEGEDREAIRERRRLERQERNRKRKEREDDLKRQIEARDRQVMALQEQMDALARRNSSADLARIQESKGKVVNAYNYFKQKIQEATEAQDGPLLAEATEKMLLAQQRYRELENIERAYANRPAAPPPTDPMVQTLASAWMEKNKWYNPAGTDVESAVMLTVDNFVVNQGFDPRTPEYWVKLSEEGAKFLPHRFKTGSAPNTGGNNVNRNVNRNGAGRNSPVGGSGRENSGSGKKGFLLSAERIQAIKEAGMWNDPEKRAKMIKQYRDYDRTHGAA